MKRFNNFTLGLVIGLILPALFIWIYLARFYPSDENVWQIVKELYPSTTLGKLLMLSIVPNLLLVFILYKQDTFKIAGGTMLGAIIYLIGSIMMS